MELRKVIISSILIAIFAVSLISFGIEFAEDNTTDISIVDNDAINRSYTDLSNDLEEIIKTGESQKESFYRDIPILGDLGLILESIAGVVRVGINAVKNFYDLLIIMISETIGVPTLVLNGILAGFLITLIILAWSVYRSGR